MSDQAYAKAQVQQKIVIGSSPKSSLLRRTCACGQHTIAGAECSTCRREQSTLLRSHRAFEPSSAPGAVPGGSPAQERGPSFNAAFDRASRFGHDFSRVPVYSSHSPVLQTKLTVNQPGDVYEQEADQVAEQVMRMTVPKFTLPDDEDEAKTSLMRTQSGVPHVATGAALLGVPLIVHTVLNSGRGRPLDTSTRAFMEPRFGHDFSRVRVHTDAQAAQSARAVNALAYTVGRDVVFGAGQYASTTHDGRKLMAHELTHVIQQDDNAHAQRQRHNATIGSMQDAHKREGERVSLLIGARRDAGRIDSPGTPPVLQRQPAPPTDDPQKEPGKKEVITQPPPQKIPAPQAKQEPQPCPPPDGLQKIQQKAKNNVKPGGGIAGGWTFHIPPRSYPHFEQGDPIQVGEKWVAKVKGVTPNPPTIQSFYPAKGTHTIVGGGPGSTKYYYIELKTAELLKQGEQEHIDDHIWAYTHTQKVIEEAINETVSLEPITIGTVWPGSELFKKEVVKMITEAAFLSRLPPELRPLGLTKNQQDQKWWLATIGVYSKLDQVTKERDVKGWHTLNSHLDSGSGQYVLDTSKTEIGKHRSEDFMKEKYEELKKEGPKK